MIVKMTIEVELEDDMYNLDDDNERLWLENEILVGDGNLILHSNDIGDSVGVVKKVRNVSYYPQNKSNINEKNNPTPTNYTNGS